ncbi:Nicotianamine synthase [Bertholletia excelsa]
MASPLQQPSLQNQVPDELLIAHIMQLHESISKLESLRPSKQVNALLTQLVKLCTLPSSIEVSNLPNEVQAMRGSLIRLCGEAEALLELEFAALVCQTPNPTNNLHLFPYYGNYVKLANLEYNILRDNGIVNPKKVAFVGSGPMPLTSIILATHHLFVSIFDNYDIDDSANTMARKIVSSDAELERRMRFKTQDVMEAREELGEYDLIFLAALVGMSKEEKMKVIAHVRKHMKPGGALLLRSVKAARAFLYPVVEEDHLSGLEVLSVFHPMNDVINSVILARKPCN